MPIGQGPIWDFSVDGNANYWHNGIISANSGKTTCAAIDIAMALTGQHPFKPYRKTGGIIIAAAQDGKNIANTMWKKLSAPGQFQIIRDELTNKWRSIRPWQEYDIAYKEKWKDAPPILPPRFFDVNRDVAWEDRKAGVPAKIVIPQTKWEIHFYSGNAMPPKGMIADIGWFDEEFQNAKAWLDEIYARLVDREGCLIWSATPQTATYALIDLHNECMKDLTKPEEKRTYGFFPMVIADNPFMTEDQKEQFYRDASQNKETYDARVHGKFIELSNKVFPEYDRDSQHHVKPFPIPWDWTVYVSIDPGYNPWAAVLAAIPPPEERYAIYIFDEIYESQCDSAKFAKVLSEKLAKHNVLPQAYIIDSHSARQTSYVSGKTGLEQIYEDLKAENSLAIQKGWVYGQADVAARVNRARHYMRIDTDQKPRLFVFRGLNWFEWEIERYTNVQKSRDGTYAPRDKDNHLMDAVSYLCAYDPKWVEKKVRRRKTSFMDWINKLSREIHGPQEASDQTTYFS